MDVRHNWGPQEWAEYIIEAHGNTVASIVETGKRFAEAKEAMPDEKMGWGKGGWRKFCEEMTGYSQPSAYMHMHVSALLITIGNNKWASMPSSWRTLYQLCQLETDQIVTLLDAGLIKRDSTRADVVFAVKQYKALDASFRKKFGDDWVEELEEHVMEYGLRTNMIDGEDIDPDQVEEEEPEAAPEEHLAEEPRDEDDPRDVALLKLNRDLIMWAENTEDPFGSDRGRVAAEGVLKFLAHKLGYKLTPT